MTPQRTAPVDLPSPAHLGWRIAAMLYDLMPLIALWMFTALVVMAGLQWATGSTDLIKTDAVAHEAVAYWLSLRLALLAVTAGYFIVSWLRGGQTIGMRAWRLQLMTADGTPLRAGQAWLRFGVAWFSLLAAGLGFLWCLVDAERRSWHDIAAGTRLVRIATPER